MAILSLLKEIAKGVNGICYYIQWLILRSLLEFLLKSNRGTEYKIYNWNWFSLLRKCYVKNYFLPELTWGGGYKNYIGSLYLASKQ